MTVPFLQAKRWLSWLKCINAHLCEESQDGLAYNYSCTYIHFKITTFVFRPPPIVASVDAALLLFTRLSAKLTEYFEHYLEVLVMSMTIILSSLSKYSLSLPDANNDKIKETLDKTGETLREWIINKDVIGGSLFGGSVKDGYPMRELEVCTALHTCISKKFCGGRMGKLYTCAYPV